VVALLLSDQIKPAAVVNAFRDGRAELLPRRWIYAHTLAYRCGACSLLNLLR
jgi:hypothetical protein